MSDRLNSAGKTAVVMGGVLPGIAAGTISVMLPGISDAFGDGSNDLQIKMVATAAGLGMMVGAPLGGVLSDRWGKMPVLALMTLVFGLAGIFVMIAGALWQVIAARFIIGFCSGTMSVWWCQSDANRSPPDALIPIALIVRRQATATPPRRRSDVP